MFREYIVPIDRKQERTAVESFEICRQAYRKQGRPEPETVYCPVGEAEELGEEYAHITFVPQRWCSTGKYLLGGRIKESD